MASQTGIRSLILISFHGARHVSVTGLPTAIATLQEMRLGSGRIGEMPRSRFGGCDAKSLEEEPC
jgi:hypothetical protein